MSTLRDHCTPEQRYAHEVLDLARSGASVGDEAIMRALAVLGESL